ncbi:hypothetical protein X975_14820, partial [Stegodyphus mimosarum]
MSKVDVKIVLLGKEYSGKTSLVERFVYDQFIGDDSYQNTIGAAFGAKKIEVSGDVLTLGLWDTAGSERYQSISRIYYRSSHAAVVCYDLTDAESFEKAKFWISELTQVEEKCKIYLCGTKKDLIANGCKQRAIDYHNVTDYADEVHAEVFETSSKTGEGVYDLFYRIAENFWREKIVIENVGNGFNILNVEEKKTRSCCS